jgi:AP-3 complex subunit delta
MRLVQPSISHLPPDIIAVYLQSTLKVFSYWTYELVGRWDDSQLRRVETTVTSILDAITLFASHADIEVQERVSNCHDVNLF